LHNKRLGQVRLVQVMLPVVVICVRHVTSLGEQKCFQITYVMVCPLISFSFIKWFFILFASAVDYFTR